MLSGHQAWLDGLIRAASGKLEAWPYIRTPAES
jgi:hypothetical protein